MIRELSREISRGVAHAVGGWSNYRYPAGAILHWDANDGLQEKAGFGHDFQSLVLGNQYQLQADGSTVNIGATMPVDTINGEKWLRSCGAVQNLLPSGAENFVTGWTKTPSLAVELQSDGWYKLKQTIPENVALSVIQSVSGTVASASVIVKKGSSNSGGAFFGNFLLRDNTVGENLIAFTVDYDTGAISYSAGSSGAKTEQQEDGSWLISVTSSWTSGNAVRFYVSVTGNNPGLSYFVYVRNPKLTATAYPVPYVPPGVTQPATNATTTNGAWFKLRDGSELWKALDGQPDGVELYSGIGFVDTQITKSGGVLTVNTGYTSGFANRVFIPVPTTVAGTRYRISCRVLSPTVVSAWLGSNYISVGLLPVGNASFVCAASDATTCPIRLETLNGSIDNISIQRIAPQPLTLATRVRMGVGSGDLPNNTFRSVVAQWAIDPPNNILAFGRNASGDQRIVSAGDGALYANIIGSLFLRNEIHIKIVQVNNLGTQFRTGNMRESVDSAIQWGAWVNYDSSFNPSTLYRLLLGFNNAYPMWFNKITAWRKQVTDAEIMEALS